MANLIKISKAVSSMAIFLVLLSSLPTSTNACEEEFEGFGIYLGSVNHFANSPIGMVKKVYEKIYNDLGIRHFRTSIESYFSPSRDVYEIVCSPSASWICSWIEVHQEISKYPDTKFMASIWSPPHYMKNDAANTLLVAEEKNYHHFIRNITEIIKNRFNITIEKVSPVNEPENVFAEWEHTNMTPQQLCRMVSEFNDSLISVCPENSYFWISEAYSNTTENANVTCLESCEIFGTHAYALNIGGDNNLKAYYDLIAYDRKVPNMPIWQTEVSSTYSKSSENQIREALDMSLNIANFVGHTCIQRYYFWYSYTLYSSGESLIWGEYNGTLTLPKKYHAYKHFTLASSGGKKKVNKIDHPDNVGVTLLTFGDSKAVFVNNLNTTVDANWPGTVTCSNSTFCCTTDPNDWDCTGNGTALPAESICSCNY